MAHRSCLDLICSQFIDKLSKKELKRVLNWTSISTGWTANRPPVKPMAKHHALRMAKWRQPLRSVDSVWRKIASVHSPSYYPERMSSDRSTSLDHRLNQRHVGTNVGVIMSALQGAEEDLLRTGWIDTLSLVKPMRAEWAAECVKSSTAKSEPLVTG